MNEFLIENSKEVLTIISVVIGGIITYISTSTVEKRKNKLQFQKEKLEKVLIPYCTCLEETVEKINKVLKKESCEEIDLENWYKEITRPLEYLRASKRVYLSKKSREYLIMYDEKVKYLNKKLNYEYEMCLKAYKDYLSDVFIKFPNVKYPMNLSISMNKYTENKLKLAIIRNKEISLVDNINQVDFIFNDDPEHWDITIFNLSNEVKETLSQIDYGILDDDDINPSIELDIIFWEYMRDNLGNDKDELFNIIRDTISLNILYELSIYIEDVKDKLIKEIDKIAG